jgi:uncharacterized protein YkwD
MLGPGAVTAGARPHAGFVPVAARDRGTSAPGTRRSPAVPVRKSRSEGSDHRRCGQAHGARNSGALTGARCGDARTSARPSRRAIPRVRSLPSQTGLEQATLARALSQPCQNEHLIPEASNLALVRASVLCLINRERAENGEQPLVADAKLEAAAAGHVQEMISSDYFDHVSPDGATPVDRAREAGYVQPPPAGFVIGENLAWATFTLATPQAIVAAWIASPGHLANILESQYSDTGIAIVAQVPYVCANGAPGATYAQEFGVITH